MRCLIRGHPLVLHAGSGAAMKSQTLQVKLAELKITSSHSRPRGSNDNAYVESLFRTLNMCRSGCHRGLKRGMKRGSGWRNLSGGITRAPSQWYRLCDTGAKAYRRRPGATEAQGNAIPRGQGAPSGRLVTVDAKLAVESGGHAESGTEKAGSIMNARGDNFVDTYRAS